MPATNTGVLGLGPSSASEFQLPTNAYSGSQQTTYSSRQVLAIQVETRMTQLGPAPFTAPKK